MLAEQELWNSGASLPRAVTYRLSKSQVLLTRRKADSRGPDSTESGRTGRRGGEIDNKFFLKNPTLTSITMIVLYSWANIFVASTIETASNWPNTKSDGGIGRCFCRSRFRLLLFRYRHKQVQGKSFGKARTLLERQSQLEDLLIVPYVVWFHLFFKVAHFDVCLKPSHITDSFPLQE